MPAPRRNAAPTRMTIADQLRSAVKEYDGSEYKLAQAAGVPRSCLSDFMSGARGLNLDTFDRLAEALGLRLVNSGRRGGRRGRAAARGRSARTEPEAQSADSSREEPAGDEGTRGTCGI